MRTLYLRSGLVVGLSNGTQTVTVTFDQPVDATDSVADESPVAIGWTYVVQGERYVYSPPSALLSRKVPPIEFKLLFSAPERVAIKTSTDPVIMDFYELVEQQREVNTRDPDRGLIDLSLQSTRDALGYMVTKEILTAARMEAILSGGLQ